ncbi:MAG TPA: hypothetical protein VFQ07_13775 [Candidatus Polarisedimenticolia bacterium]|nr:hypothetical protein [Candidatus Polarisedimenticolia bacterium]
MPRKNSARRARAMRDIDRGLRMLGSGLRRLARDVSTIPVAGNGRAVRRRPVTRALKLQGRYMGLIRTLPVRLKLQVKAIRAKQGVEQAIRKARALKD